MLESLKRWLDALEFDFVSWRYVAGGVSGLMVLASWAVFIGVGPNWGIDFTGGTEIHLKFQDEADITDVRGALRELGLSDDAVQAVNGSDSGEFIIRIQDTSFGMEGLEEEVKKTVIDRYGKDWFKSMTSAAEVSARFVIDYAPPYKSHQEVTRELQDVFPGLRATPGKDEFQIVLEVPGLSERIKDKIATAMGAKAFEVLSTDAVGPKVGGELRRQGFTSIAATLALVLLYVAFRFELGFAPGAILALVHDVSITVGIFVLAQLEFNLPMIGALLTIVGYSLNDTIVIYDRIRENRDRYRRSNTASLINTSINETLTRTIATSFTTLLAITMFLVIGGPVIRNFALAMFLGIIFGTYSTVFVASPMILVMEDLRPYFEKLIVSSDAEASDSGDESDGPMTETEKRRRARNADQAAKS